MTHRLSRPVAAIALGFTLFTGVGGHDTRALAVSKGSPSGLRPVKPYALVVSLPKVAYRPDEQITASIEFQNLVGPEVTIWISGIWPNHKVVVTDEAGVEPPMTDAGKGRRDAFSPGGGRDKNYPRIVKRGEKYRYDVGDIEKLYDLAPGKYRLEVTYDDEQEPTPLRITSNPVKLSNPVKFEVK